LKVLSVTSEIFPLVKTGGLADVTGSLPNALSEFEVETVSLVPGYPGVMARLRNVATVATMDLFGAEARILRADSEGLDLFVLDIPVLYDRPGGPYLDEQGIDFAENSRRFAALSLGGALIADGAITDWKPDLVHTHDWQSALTSVYLRYRLKSSLPTVLTIHNLAFQGQFPFDHLSDLGIPPEARSTECLEYYGDTSFLKGGVQTADIITTVSPTYAREILGEGLGMGMEGVLKANRKKLRGIVNGIDDDVWNPATDLCLVQNFDRNSLAARSLNRKHLINLFDFQQEEGPIFSVISRLTWQKGIDLLVQTVPHLVEAGGRLIICGEGDHHLHDLVRNLAKQYPHKVAVSIGYNEGLAHVIYGGSDFLMALKRMDNIGIVVEDLAAAIHFFKELGLELEGRAMIDGEWAGRVTGLGDQHVEIAMMRTPDGHSRLELSRFLKPEIISDHRNAPVNALDICEPCSLSTTLMKR